MQGYGISRPLPTEHLDLARELRARPGLAARQRHPPTEACRSRHHGKPAPRLERQPDHRRGRDRRTAPHSCSHPQRGWRELSHGASLDDYEAITHELLSYALYHFETEEALMQEYGYAQDEPPTPTGTRPNTRSFTQQVLTVREQLKAGILTPPTA